MPMLQCIFMWTGVRNLPKRWGAKLLAEEPYYAHVDKYELGLVTRVTMTASDWFKMVKMIHITLNG